MRRDNFSILTEVTASACRTRKLHEEVQCFPVYKVWKSNFNSVLDRDGKGLVSAFLIILDPRDPGPLILTWEEELWKL